MGSELGKTHANLGHWEMGQNFAHRRHLDKRSNLQAFTHYPEMELGITVLYRTTESSGVSPGKKPKR